jgi:hypothetical protein
LRITGLLSVLILCGLTGCANLPGSPTVSRKPDQVLFEQARGAIELEKYDVDRLSLRTLINTSPNSGYVKEAERLLEDSQLADACDAWYVGVETTDLPQIQR